VGFIKLSAEVGRQTVRQHQEVVRMIEKQDPEGAAEAMAAHLDYLAAQGVERANATSEPVSVKRPPWSDVSSPELSRVWPPTPPA
jgi:hypothetical protein